MRNLYRVSHLKNALPEGMGVLSRDTSVFAVGQTNQIDQMFCTTAVGLFQISNLKTPHIREQTGDSDTPQHRPDAFNGDEKLLLACEAGYRNIIAIEHLVLTNELCCASRDGNVWSHNLDTGVTEEVTHCEHGIRAMQWSPSQEVVVFVDGKLNVVTMVGSEYEPINEVQLADDTFGDRAFMSVGWGKKETQFHGSDGKAAAAAAAKKEPQPEDCAGNDDDATGSQPVDISWRGDGEMFAVSFHAPREQRAFKVFDKEGALLYTSERCRGLRNGIAWRPSGQWLAVPQERAPDEWVIALFEKNGLRHSEIALPFQPPGCRVENLHWSPDSDALAVQWCPQGSATGDCVHIYVMGNYHWYLKQCVRFGDLAEAVNIQWDQRDGAGKTLHAALRRTYERIRFEFRVDRSVGHGEDDEAMVAVIDGSRLHLSAFRRTVIPPPMCSYTLSLPDGQPINAVGFLRTPGANHWSGQLFGPNAFFVVDAANAIHLYDVAVTPQGTRTVLTGVRSMLTIRPDQWLLDASYTHTHWLWLAADRMVFSCQDECFVLYLRWMDGRSVEPLAAIDGIEMDDDETIGCIEASGPNHALVELSSGLTMEVELTLDAVTVEEHPPSRRYRTLQTTAQLHTALPAFCEQLFVDPGDPARRRLYALDQCRRRLYRDGALLASEVTSAVLADAHLLFTTVAELRFVPLGGASGAIVGERRLERGSKLVTVVPGAARTVFQLPRGNLEAICPRVLSLGLIAKHLDALEYRAAFDIMRKERINLNLLIDHNATRFLAHLGTHFLPQITNVHWLSLFVTDLANQDVCRAMYASNYPDRRDGGGGGGGGPDGYTVAGKVPYVCEQLLGAMDPEPAVLTLPKLTCHVKRDQLEAALALVWTLRRTDAEAADEALRHLLYLVEVNALYDVALGMYDFGLVLFVATKSQKDPREYLPFLNELKRLDEPYRRYRIDCHLKRYARALGHIAGEASDERFREALELIVTHGLYTAGLECYGGSGGVRTPHYQTVCERYGDHLRKGGRHAEASLMYERAGCVQQAIASARHALDWRRVLRLVGRSPDGPDGARAVLRSLVPALVEAGEHEAAATVAHEHLHHVRLAVDCLLKDNRYPRALLLLSATAAGDDGHGDGDDLHQIVREHLRHYLGTFGDTVTAEQAQFLYQKGRLALVRAERERARLMGPDEGEPTEGGDCGDCDLFSDSSTVASSRHTSSSGRSGKSHRSSKNRRKHERKLLNLKEGNAFEDLALVDALHALVLRVCGVERQRHVHTLCQVALELGFDGEARAIQRAYAALFRLVRYSLDAIWLPEMVVPSTVGPTTTADDDGGEANRDPAATPSPTTTTIHHTSADLLQQAQNAERYALIKPHQRYKPDIQSIAWEWDILQ